MRFQRKILVATGLSLIVLVACDGSDGTLGNPASQFGRAFAAAFSADSTDQPSDDLTIIYRGVTGVSLTEEPVDI